MKTLLFPTLLAMLATALPALAANDEGSSWEKAYPAAGKGMNRFVLHLPVLADEYSAKVELIVGREEETDGVNIVHFSGKIVEKNIEGWGYPRYDVTVGDQISTLIGVSPDQPKVKKFVTLAVDPYLVRYNSKLPIVVYVPDGYELRYRIWQASPTSKTVEKG